MRHILLKKKLENSSYFAILDPTNSNKIAENTSRPNIIARHYLLHSFLIIPMCKGFTETAGIVKKMQFSIISGHTVRYAFNGCWRWYGFSTIKHMNNKNNNDDREK